MGGSVSRPPYEAESRQIDPRQQQWIKELSMEEASVFALLRIIVLVILIGRGVGFGKTFAKVLSRLVSGMSDGAGTSMSRPRM
jgi:hypothetical protein